MVRSMLLLTVAAPIAALAQTQPVTPPPSAPVTPPAAVPAPTTPLDSLLLSAKPLAADDKAALERLQTVATADCKTAITVDHGAKYSIDLKKMQAMAVNTNLMISGGGQSVQMVFDGKDGAKQAADAEKMISDLNDKCS